MIRKGKRVVRSSNGPTKTKTINRRKSTVAKSKFKSSTGDSKIKIKKKTVTPKYNSDSSLKTKTKVRKTTKAPSRIKSSKDETKSTGKKKGFGLERRYPKQETTLKERKEERQIRALDRRGASAYNSPSPRTGMADYLRGASYGITTKTPTKTSNTPKRRDKVPNITKLTPKKGYVGAYDTSLPEISTIRRGRDKVKNITPKKGYVKTKVVNDKIVPINTKTSKLVDKGANGKSKILESKGNPKTKFKSKTRTINRGNRKVVKTKTKTKTKY
tara:strand:- start:5434 stop:6249 length:816 start_codon:yes stop_codon:yes gene_type:complete